VFENRVLRRIFGRKRDEKRGVEKNYIMRSLMMCALTQYCFGDKIVKNEMGAACSAYGGQERHIQGFGGETCGKDTTWETQAWLGG